MAHYCDHCKHNMKTSSRSSEDLLRLLIRTFPDVVCEKCGTHNKVDKATILAELGERIDNIDRR
jgi:hypothetical protein